MTLSQLKIACAAYLQKTTGDLTISGVDLFLVAANNARKNGELLHDFEHARVTAALSIDGVTGANLSSAVIDSLSSPNSVLVTGTLVPNVTGVWPQIGVSSGFPVYATIPSSGDTYILASDGTAWSITDVTSRATKWDGPTATFPVGTYSPANGATGTLTVVTSAWNGIKSVVAVSRQRPDGTYVPLDFARADVLIERDRTELEFSDNLFPYLRYPSDAQINARGTNSSLIQRGNTLSIHPVYATATDSTYAVLLEAFAWLRDYVAADLDSTVATDFFLTNGFSYMQWATICELNYLTQTFVQRVEGSLAPPEKMREDAWNRFLLWDSYLVDANSTRSR